MYTTQTSQGTKATTAKPIWKVMWDTHFSKRNVLYFTWQVASYYKAKKIWCFHLFLLAMIKSLHVFLDSPVYWKSKQRITINTRKHRPNQDHKYKQLTKFYELFSFHKEKTIQLKCKKENAKMNVEILRWTLGTYLTAWLMTSNGLVPACM